ncbi:5'-nucleotidase C-terminal domain-containing protein [Carnobacteriaceae bacterium 52-44]
MSDEEIYIYHTNDIHSDLTFWPRIAQELQEKRTIREQNDDDVFVFDIGDATDRVHPLTEATDGQAITELLNEGLYDGVTIGNNEGITNSKNELNNLYNAANFPVILSNLFELETEEIPEWAILYKIFNTKSGDRIGVFGLTTPLYHTYEKLGWKVTNPIKQTQEFYKEHGDKADFWILLSHLGIEEDRLISKLFPIPLIIGAHSHHVLLDGERSAASMLTGAGQFGHWIGEVVISRAHGRLQVETAELINAETDIQPVEAEEQMVEEYTNHGHRLLQNEKIADLPENLLAKWNQQTKLADIVLDAIADFTDTDAAILNAGLFMGDLNLGVVTADDLHHSLPHPIRVMHCKIKGKHLLRFGEEIQNVDKKMMNRSVRGFGFRGEVFGKLCLKGFRVDNGHMLWKNQPIEPQKKYELATIDYFSFLPFFDILNTYSTQEIIFPDFLRKVVGDYLAEIFPLTN